MKIIIISINSIVGRREVDKQTALDVAQNGHRFSRVSHALGIEYKRWHSAVINVV